MKQILIFTSARSEFGLAKPFYKKISRCSELNIEFCVFGMHLSEEFGRTMDEILDSGFNIKYEIPKNPDSNKFDEFILYFTKDPRIR